MIEKQKRQWQDNGKTMTINMTKKRQKHTKTTSFLQILFSWSFNIFCHFSVFLCHVFVMFHCFPLCFHDSSVWCVMFNCFFFRILLFLLIFPSRFIVFCHFSMGFFPFCLFFFFVGFLHVFIGFLLLCQMFSLFFLVLIDLSMVLLFWC